MNLTELVNPVVLALAAISLLLSLGFAFRMHATARLIAGALLALAGLLLAGSLALPGLLPAASGILSAGGNPADPRVASALLVGAAAFALLLPGMRALRIHAMGLVGHLLPGLLVGGLVAAGGFIIGLRQAPAMAGLALGGLVIGSALAHAARYRGQRIPMAIATQAAGLGLLVIGALSSLHGARAAGISIAEGGSADTLGVRIAYVATEAPSDSLRRMRFALGSGNRSDTTWAELQGRPGPLQRPRVAGVAKGGPVLVPLSLEESRRNPHGVLWLRKGETIEAGEARVKFEAFRFVMGDTIRLHADLEVTHHGKSSRISPGVVANSKGEIPFSDVVEGYGPIAVAGVDADNGRVALMLPTSTDSGIDRIALVELRLRPGLTLAWTGLAVATLAFLLTFGASASEGTPRGQRDS